ncbi:MAG: S41 family peptidase, partial [Chloroflexi bacterium]
MWEILQKDFYGELPDEREMTYAAIRGMLETLNDPYTSFLEPEIAAIEREDASGTFEGIGAMVRMNEQGFLEIVWPFEGQPADKAGLRPGDVIIAVDGQSIEGYSIYEAITLIRGPEGTDVVLTVQREGVEEPFDVVVTRARIDIPLVRSTMLEGGIAYVSLFDFSSQAKEQLEETLRDLLAQNPKGLIFDLRGNPGGFLQEAVDVADLFLDEGVVLIERDAHGGENVYRSGPKGIAQEIPLVVLVNGGSASAAEIVAGAIQDRGRGILIGQRTFGKGSVQLPRTLSDGSELRVTIARWFTPNDRAIHGQGLTPDIEVGAGLAE